MDESRRAAFDGSISRQGPKKKGPQNRGYWDIDARVSCIGSEAFPSRRRRRRRRLVVSRTRGCPPPNPPKSLSCRRPPSLLEGKTPWRPTQYNWGPDTSVAHDATRHDIFKLALHTTPEAAAPHVNCRVPLPQYLLALLQAMVRDGISGWPCRVARTGRAGTRRARRGREAAIGRRVPQPPIQLRDKCHWK